MSKISLDPRFMPVPDPQTVTADGERIEPWIDGLVVHPLKVLEDHRGWVTEIYRPAWGLHPMPLVYAYEVMVRPGTTRGWVVHYTQADRIFLTRGTLWWAMYDAREHSPTSRMLNQFVISDANRALLIVPAGVFHAVKNIGAGDAVFINLPTEPYDHAHPDKHRVPMDGVTIPFTFDRAGNAPAGGRV